MRIFAAQRFFELGALLVSVEGMAFWAPRDRPIPDDVKQRISQELQRALDLCRESELAFSASLFERIAAQLSGPLSRNDFSNLCQEAHNRISDELATLRSLQIPRGKESLFDGHDLWGKEIASSLGQWAADVDEAGRCLALSRSTGAVFHLMRVMEATLRLLGGSLGIELRSPNWETLLGKIERDITQRRESRTPPWPDQESFDLTTVAHLRTVKLAWRNPTMHVDQTYSEEEAMEIFTAVQAFVRHTLAALAK